MSSNYVLMGLEKPLDVVYTVSLREVAQHLPKWVQSTDEEMETLIDPFKEPEKF